MKVKELMNILKDFHPDEEVGFFSLSNKYMQILGINEEKTARNGMPVFSIDWCIDRDKPKETPRDKLERQARLIQEAIDRMDDQEEKKLRQKVRHYSKKNRTDTQMLLDGLIPTGGKRGRPRKIVTEKDFEPKPIGRPKKVPAEEPKPATESNQDFSQPIELFGLDSTL